MAPTGVCKIRNGWGNEDGVVIRHDDGEEHEIPASRYIEKGYRPSLGQDSCARNYICAR